ncbi:MAG: 7-carboxy-7-deazaguanine synthase QueE [Candidatus Binatia bacterium]
MRISELFYSLQGEGKLLGTPSVFIRASGCNLRCVWCDTPYTSWKPEGKEWSLGRILAAARKYPTRYAVITGGEPFLAPDLGQLTEGLKRERYHITIETAATIFTPVRCDLMSISPKLANSTPWKRENGKFAAMHEQRRLNLPVIQRLMRDYDYQLKFVVDKKPDFAGVRRILGKLKNVEPSRVVIMAQGTSRAVLREKARWIVEICKTSGFSYTPRLQIELYGNRRGT